MRIVQVIQRPQLRGAELFACQLSNHLIQSGNEVVVISIFSGDAQLPFAGKILNLERPLAYRFFDWKGWRLLANVVKQMNPDIIQANAGDTLKFVVFSKLLFAWKKPIVFRNASTVSSYIRSTPVLLINRFLYKQVSLVVSVSEFSKTDLVRLFPFLENKTVRIPIGIELERGEQLPPAENTPYLVHVGGFTFEKIMLACFVFLRKLAK